MTLKMKSKKLVAHFFGVLLLLSAYHYKKGADFMKSKYEWYLEMERWYKKQERKSFIKYYITNLFKR